MDIASRERFPKEELLRIVVCAGVVTPDTRGNLPGRGVYIKKDAASLELAVKRKALERAFHRPLTEEEKTAILEAL